MTYVINFNVSLKNIKLEVNGNFKTVVCLFLVFVEVR